MDTASNNDLKKVCQNPLVDDELRKVIEIDVKECEKCEHYKPIIKS